jgi:formate hydrogenlyase subunit 3/multisubunit Na+/H+ antiporter MnhD subunit
MNIVLLFLSKGLSTFLGWVGTFLYLIAYLLLSLNKLKADQRLYHVLNIFGAIGLAYNAVSLNDYPNVIVNTVWAIIALFAILLIGRRKQN